MCSITLVRHGQANSAAKNETEYDKLSDLGHQQARWLGEHMRATGQEYDTIYTGSLKRQQQTAKEWGASDFTADIRFDEVRYFDLSERMHSQFGLTPPKNYEDFVDHFPLTFAAWQDGKIDNPPETFHDFQTRIFEAVREVAGRGERAIIFTSGGVIGMVVQLAMGLDIGPYSRAVLPIMNSSVHRFKFTPAGLILTQYNTVSHLEIKDRHYAQTVF